MGDVIVREKTAKLAKEKGYDGHTNYYWPHNKEVEEPTFNPYYNCWNSASLQIAAPTQEALANWLRKHHEMHITVPKSQFGMGFRGNITHIGTGRSIPYTLETHPEYSDSFEAVLQYALEQIK